MRGAARAAESHGAESKPSASDAATEPGWEKTPASQRHEGVRVTTTGPGSHGAHAGGLTLNHCVRVFFKVCLFVF